MIEIPRFSASELKDIVHLFGQEGVPFHYRGLTTSVSRYGGVTEYILIVDKEDFDHCIDLLKEYFVINTVPDEPFVGVCPACEARIDGLFECPECGLSMRVGTLSQTKSHPFYGFLRSNGLLPQEEPNPENRLER